MKVVRRLQLLLSALVLLLGVGLARAQTRNDGDREIKPSHEESDAKDSGVDRDNPTERLEAERARSGMVTATFRENAMKEGRGHSGRKNRGGRTWVNIGPTGADFEQNGSFTGHVRDSGRARSILPHPT